MESASKPLISILIPLYNAQDYIADCLDSIVTQTYQNLEIVIVNDESTDISAAICQQYAEKDPRIKLIHQENRGLAETRNVGMAHMNGDFFTFFDNDDMMAPDFIETMYREMSDDTDIVCMKYLFASENTQYSQIKDKQYKKSTTLVFGGKDSFKELAYMETFLPSSHGKLFRTKTMGAIRYRPYFHEDLGNVYKFFLAARRVVKIQRVGYYYRIRQGSMMNSKFTKEKEDILDLADTMLENIKDASLLPYANLLLFINFAYQYVFCIDVFHPLRKEFRKKIAEFAKGAEGIEKPSARLEAYKKSLVLYLEKQAVKQTIKRFLRPYYHRIKRKIGNS